MSNWLKIGMPASRDRKSTDPFQPVTKKKGNSTNCKHRQGRISEAALLRLLVAMFVGIGMEFYTLLALRTVMMHRELSGAQISAAEDAEHVYPLGAARGVGFTAACKQVECKKGTGEKLYKPFALTCAESLVSSTAPRTSGTQPPPPRK
ncbi:hypothetical protein B0H16DRAFT_1463630 [Mycena metata]|uniref:Uncharacterized protein n=1 Tax=Mycena metata TaxID=1033252 RepID=A0AAD7IJI2_9AGAR|nr:hypothetical protein B0H16DRAFT_1463630 [Mycena metata]